MIEETLSGGLDVSRRKRHCEADEGAMAGKQAIEAWTTCEAVPGPTGASSTHASPKLHLHTALSRAIPAHPHLIPSQPSPLGTLAGKPSFAAEDDLLCGARQQGRSRFPGWLLRCIVHGT